MGCAALALAGCAPIRPVVHPAPPVAPPAPVLLTIHVDDAFPIAERNLVESAAIALNVQTGGLVTIRLISGLDTARFWVPPGEWRLMRILADDDLTRRFDYRNAKGVSEPIVGICVRADHSLYLVPDRIRTSQQMVSVAMHEILHAVGLEHGGGRTAVMHPVVVDNAPVRLSDADVTALRVTLTPHPEHHDPTTYP